MNEHTSRQFNRHQRTPKMEIDIAACVNKYIYTHVYIYIIYICICYTHIYPHPSCMHEMDGGREGGRDGWMDGWMGVFVCMTVNTT